MEASGGGGSDQRRRQGWGRRRKRKPRPSTTADAHPMPTKHGQAEEAAAEAGEATNRSNRQSGRRGVAVSSSHVRLAPHRTTVRAVLPPA